LHHLLTPSATAIFNVNSDADFLREALQVFRYQAVNNPLYNRYLKMLGVAIDEVEELQHIPFLPIEFFKSHQLITGNGTAEEIFTSSGTSGMVQSKHYVTDVKLYEKSYRKTFELFYGNISDYCILALLPSYLERDGSSLIYMADDLIKHSTHPDSGFYLNNYEELLIKLEQLEQKKQKTILLGVTYSLLDMAELYTAGKNKKGFQYTIIMETGGMKGKGREMIREELHQVLCSSFGVKAIHSEYGMTELLSQAYSKGEGKFNCPPWMRILIRDTTDPFTFLSTQQTGGINIIDLANIHSCAFIASQDLGKITADGSFEILGRFDASDVRGCNLLI
jgi:phenylacetate-coenzyme A ligase PaaK-like adenylate-forming protein